MTLLLNLLILVTVSSAEVIPGRKSRDKKHTFPDGEHNPHFDHETFLGDQKEAEMFDELPPEEAKDRLGLLAKKMDKNDDGFIDKKELSNWLFKSMKMLSQNEAEESFKEHDADHNGVVDWNEYLKFELESIESDGTEPEQVAENKKEIYNEDKALFDAADVGKDGKLNFKEYQLFLNPHDHLDTMAMVILDKFHKIQDINKDGKIDFDEYKKNQGKDQDVEGLKEQKDLFQSTMDKNGDGTLDRKEIIDWLDKENHERATEQAEHLFFSADDNRDGKFSMKEIVGHHDVFVGSEITNFGDHLHKVERFEDEL